MMTTLGQFQYGTVSYLNSFAETLHSPPAAHPAASGARARCDGMTYWITRGSSGPDRHEVPPWWGSGDAVRAPRDDLKEPLQ
ncbi:hypothetical protein GCM10010121_080630 [Streptomyces brasiliensis]|uniref:Uncharacterized protein n=1 Tax=Streptomyces brasiliensis TaxID=1954 RepID=A0A917LDC1_9ACTN|nr:hypothetical protein GCM10010121_080630 [Streptomyces brasiliensis]